MYGILIGMSLKFVPEGLDGDKSGMVLVGNTWRWRGDKPLTERMMATLLNAYIHIITNDARVKYWSIWFASFHKSWSYLHLNVHDISWLLEHYSHIYIYIYIYI